MAPEGRATPLGKPEPHRVAAFWERFLADQGMDQATAAPEAWAFGSCVEMADELCDLVLHGPKRATAGVVVEYEAEGEEIPKPGDHSIITDGTMRPRAVVRTTDVRVGPLDSVDDQFAWDEGEGDRTRQWWLDAHANFFRPFVTGLGHEFTMQIATVFERFDLVYSEQP